MGGGGGKGPQGEPALGRAALAPVRAGDAAAGAGARLAGPRKGGAVRPRLGAASAATTAARRRPRNPCDRPTRGGTPGGGEQAGRRARAAGRDPPHGSDQPAIGATFAQLAAKIGRRSAASQAGDGALISTAGACGA